MTRILFVGQQPETVDFSDPALPPGLNAAKINAGIAIAMAKMAERGWQADLCLITPDAMAGPVLEKQLGRATYDCVVIGGGLRLPPKSLPLFETVINAVHKAAPHAAIALNTRPEDTAEAAARWLNADRSPRECCVEAGKLTQLLFPRKRESRVTATSPDPYASAGQALDPLPSRG